MNNSKNKSVLIFFLLAAAFYIPFVIFADVQISPGISLINLATFIPVTTALILVYRENKFAGMIELVKRSFDYKRIKSKAWYLPIFLLYLFIMLVQYGLAILSGVNAPSPHISFWMTLIFIIFFIAALGEELGWMGYAFEPLQERFGALNAGILMGIIWSLIHIPLFTASFAYPYWIIWQCIYIATTRILFVWIYNNTGKSLFAMGIMHTSFNGIWQLFPPSGGLLVPSFYNPRNLALTTIILAVIVTFLWGPKTLAQYRYTRTAN